MLVEHKYLFYVCRMKALSKAEEKVLHIIWSQEPTYLKDIRATYPDPKPAKTTLATLLKRISDKGFITYDQEGGSRYYRSSVSKTKYLQLKIKNLIGSFFDSNPAQFASFFAEEMELSEEEVKEVKALLKAAKSKDS